MWPAP